MDNLFDLTKYFDIIIGGEDVIHSKPHPEGLLKVMKETECRQGVMIGDNVSDILSGKHAGIYTIGVKWSPKGQEEIKQLKPDLMIDQMKEIIKFIERVS